MMTSESDTDEASLLESTDLTANHFQNDLLPATIDAQATDNVKNLLAQTKDFTRDGVGASTSCDQQSIFSESDHSILDEALGPRCDSYDASVEWQTHDLHVFVLSEAGKPVYTRYGDEGQLASIMGVMQALVSFVAASGDELQSIEAEDRQFIFLSRPHLILVAVGRPKECRAHLIVCLGYVYNQILSLLTLERLKQRFEYQKNLDLRRLLIGDSRLISSVINFAENALGAFLQAVAYLPLAQHSRDQIAHVISQSIKCPTVVFALLFHQKHVVSLVSMKGHTLMPMDLHLILNLVSNSEQLKTGQTHWLPICLPQFDANGFMYAHISFLDDATSLVILSVDSQDFYTLETAKDKIVEKLRSGDLLRPVVSADFPILSKLGIPELRHVVCKFIPVSQYVSTDWAPVYLDHFTPPDAESPTRLSYPLKEFTRHSKGLRLDILQTYRRMHARLHNPDYPTRFVFQATSTEAFAVWRIDAFEFYCTMEPLTTKPILSEIRKHLAHWIQSHKSQFFALSNPTF